MAVSILSLEIELDKVGHQQNFRALVEKRQVANFDKSYLEHAMSDNAVVSFYDRVPCPQQNLQRTALQLFAY